MVGYRLLSAKTWKWYREFKVCAETLAKSWPINRHKSSVIKNHCMVSCYLWVRRLDVKEIWWVENRSFWNEGIKTDTTSLMDSKKNQWMDSGKNWSNKNFVSKYKDNKVTLFWTHHETQLYWKGYQPRNLIRKEEKRKPKDNMVRQHHSVDKYGLGKNTESNGQQKSMEKDDPWCGRIEDRGWLKSSQVSQCKQT